MGSYQNVDAEKGGVSVLDHHRTCSIWSFSPKFFILFMVVALILTLLFYIPEKAFSAIASYRVCHIDSETINETKIFSHFFPPIISGLHIKCRTEPYPRNHSIHRFKVPEDKMSWSVPFPGYNPTDWTAEKVLVMPEWADYDIRLPQYKNMTIEFNQLDWDSKIDRRSHHGPYKVIDRLPRNPAGRTGMVGRGLLGRWGPNHSGDPVITRWKRDAQGNIVKHPSSGKPILQFICEKRGDTGEWSLPGGMVDPGESHSITLRREFMEEALDSLMLNETELEKIEERVQKDLAYGVELYRGYADDPRNTDNTWMETIAVNFHDPTGNAAGSLHIVAGDDVLQVLWMDIDDSLKMFSSHAMFVKLAAKRNGAHL